MKTASGGGEAYVDVVFRGVIAYHLEGDCFENIVYEIEEVQPESVVGDGRGFAERHRLCGWPPGWDPRAESAQQFLSRSGVRVFELRCSYGAEGWIAAQSMESIVATPA